MTISTTINKDIPQRYIVDGAKEFSGSICSATYTTMDGIERVAYRDNITLADYLVDHPTRKVITGDETDALFNAYYETLKTQPMPITKAQYWDWLEVLPPCRWHNIGGATVFYVSERLCANLVQWCMQIGDKYFGFTDDASISLEQLRAHASTALKGE